MPRPRPGPLGDCPQTLGIQGDENDVRLIGRQRWSAPGGEADEGVGNWTLDHGQQTGCEHGSRESEQQAPGPELEE